MPSDGPSLSKTSNPPLSSSSNKSLNPSPTPKPLMPSNPFSTSFKPVKLFGTLLHETSRGYLFAPEDNRKHAFWLTKRIASWDGVEMTLPLWIARKRKLISYPPDDNHPAWWIILNANKPVLVCNDEIIKLDEEESW